MRAFVAFCNLLYIIVSAVLVAIAVALIVYAVWNAVTAIRGEGGRPVYALLSAIGLIVISLAVLDVGKYLVEEEVLRDRELRSPTEARRTLTKFMVIICIAVSLEAIVNVAKVEDSNLPDLVYPAILLLSAVAIMVGLGIYQRLSGMIESKDKLPQTAHEARDSEKPQS